MPGTARITGVGAYVEVVPDQTARVTNVGAYVEMRPISYARITGVGAYVEMRRLVTPDLRLRHGKGFVDGVLLPYNSDV